MRRISTLVLLSLFLISCNTLKRNQSKEIADIQKELTEKLTAISPTLCFNGFGIALVNNREILYKNGFGITDYETKQKYDEHTVQNIASVSKTFIGIALLKAQELGKLKLDDPINAYLPFKVANPYYPDIPITIRHLATHTSSINDTEGYLTNAIVLKDTTNLAENLKIDISPTKFNPPAAKISIEEFLINILDPNGKWYEAEGFLRNEPGAIFNYSNIGSTLAALVLEKATGTSYNRFTTTHILEPLQMNSSGWSISTIDFSKYTHTFQNKTTPYPYYSLNTYPDGGMLTTSGDMSKYILELMKGYYGGGTILSKESYREYFTPHLNTENFIDRSTSEYSDEYNMGITIGFGSTGNFGHTGGDPGLFSVIWFDKDSGIGRYFIVNTECNTKEFGKSQKAIYDLLDEYSVKLNELSKARK
ncbi:serine hydrolase domain-containing protein [uncultured Pontibacter sp.]|uniref:serine hydrolase domain-containing protein n=1 Tax=uncultured Pontibacter sp. TaxID=453356 RepID=UPI002615E7A0|nr:serine hydrolase domain-containing protein [uncultured Pontibacter sp.]